MKLSEVLRAGNVVYPLQATTLHEGAAALLAHAVAVDGISDAERIRERLAASRAEDVVVLADRAFIFHLRTDATNEMSLVAGISPQPIARDPADPDSASARVLLLLLAPPRRAAEHLQLIGAVGRYFSRETAAGDLIAHAAPEALRSYLESVEFDLPLQLRVRDIMTPRPRTTQPDATLREAAREMVRASLGGLVVVDAASRVVGLLGEKELMRDLLTNYLQGGTSNRDAPASTGRRKVRDVMTRQVLGVSPDQPLAEIASIMVNKDVERVPVVEDGQLVGVLTRADIVRKLIGY